MRSNRALVTFMAVITMLAAGACGTERPAPTPPSGPAMVLITVDGLIPSQLGLFGGPTPVANLQGLAEGGVAWKDAWTPCPMTAPAVASYLTGMAPDRHGLTDDLVGRMNADVPTLAEKLEAAGYRTAAFPGSAFLGSGTLMLRGFETVDEPPAVVVGPHRRLPPVKPAAKLVTDLKVWLTGIPPGERYFAWIHFADPWHAFLDEKGDAIPKAVATVDSAVGEVLKLLRERNEFESTVVALVGTFGDVRGGKDDVPGPGFSVAREVLEVPMILRLGKSVSAVPPSGSPPWGLDIAVTLARRAGVDLPGADGVDLAGSVADGRVQMAWSWAPRDQMGWKVIRAARKGKAIQFEQGDAGEEARDPGLTAALGERPVRLSDGGLAESVRPMLEKRGVSWSPFPLEGRDFQPRAKRREVAAQLWKARHSFASNRTLDGGRATKAVLAADPDNLATLIERGMLLLSTKKLEGQELLTRAIQHYPWDTEAVHWYGHAIESGDKSDSEAFFKLVVPLRPSQGDLLYDLACTRSLAGDVDQAASYLERAIRAGFRRWELITADPDLRKLRESPKFAEVMREFGR